MISLKNISKTYPGESSPAVTPPIMLMDEPFAAVDPITRTQLQNEFLSLQKKIQKTICSFNHDIDEAIKMGDKIAILNQGN